MQGGGPLQVSGNAEGLWQQSPALTLRPEAETVDRALAKEISRDLSLMMLAASIANTAIASLHAQQLNSVQGIMQTQLHGQHSTAQHSTAHRSSSMGSTARHVNLSKQTCQS